MRTKIFTLIVGVLAMAFIGCTRAAKDASKLNLTIASSVAGEGSLAASTLVLSHVSINVSGSGINGAVISTWDNCQDCSNQPPIPTSFPVSVPSGSGRLIQILAVYKDSSTNQMSFYYGDLSKDITGSEVTAEINVAKVGTGNITSGRVAGRYFTTATGGPTGLIDIKYNPGGGKLPLIVDNAVIVNGWFSIFMLSGASLQYSVRGSGEILWAPEVSFESSAMDPAENSGAYFDQRVRALLPVHIEKREQNNTTTFQIQDAETFVWGYWGPGATGKKICTSGLDSSPVPQRLKQYKAGDPSGSDPLSVSHYINWNLSVPTKAQLTDTTTPYTYVVFQGGESMSSGCSSFPDTFANQFTNFQKITLNQIDGNGGDSVAGFTGIFRNNSNNNFVTVSNADPKVITGDLLPGVEEVFSGLRLFKRVSTEDYRLNVAMCNDLPALGFVPASSTDAPVTASGNVSLTSNITAAEGISGVSAVICPTKAGVMNPIGMFLSKWNFNIGGTSVSTATNIALVTPQKSTTTGAFLNNLCNPVTIEARTASGTLGYLPSPITVNLSSNDGNTAFYTYSGCSGSVNSVQMSSQSTTIYVKRAMTGTTSTTITASAPAAGFPGNTANVSFYDLPGTITPKIMITAPTSISAYECYPVTFESWNSNLYLVNFYDSYATTFSLPMVTASGLNFYSNGDCANTPLTSANLGSNPQQVAYMKYTGNATSLNIQPTSISPASPILTSDISGGTNITVVQPGTATTLDLMMPMSFPANQCQMITIRSVDANGRTAPATSAMSLDLATTISGGTYYQYSGCTTPITSINFATATTTQVVYFKASSTTASDTVTVSSATPAMSVTRILNVTPEVYSQMFVVLPGQSYSAGSGVTGTPMTIPQGIYSYAQIYLVKADGQIDTNANGMLLTGGTITGGGTLPQAPTTLNFSGGVGSLPFMPDGSYSTMYLNLNSNTLYYNSPGLQSYLPATMMGIYMSNQTTLAPGGCQIFAVMPESTDGPSKFYMPAMFNISADNGGSVYIDAACTNAASGTYTFSDTDRIKAFYFKQPTNSTTSAITVTSLTGGVTSSPITVGTNAVTTGTSYNYLFTGRSTSMNSHICNPYLVSVSDNQGRSVAIGSDQSISLTTSGSYGMLTDDSCNSGVVTMASTIDAANNFATVYVTNMVAGNPHQVTATGSPLSSGVSASMTPNP